jgi:hypothetical protein
MKYPLLFDYTRLRDKLVFVSRNDDAALRSLKKKYEELQDDSQASYEQAKAQLIQEYIDCLPVDA